MKKIGKMFLSIFTLLAVLATGLSSKFPALALELAATTTLVSQAQVAVETMNVSNDTTATDILTVVQDAIGDATATWTRDFYLQRAVNGAIVKVDGVEVSMPPKELELLFFLASTPNKVYTRDQLLEYIWGYDFFGDTRTVDTHIKRIRQKLPQEGVPWSLVTVYGVGYIFGEE